MLERTSVNSLSALVVVTVNGPVGLVNRPSPRLLWGLQRAEMVTEADKKWREGDQKDQPETKPRGR